MCIWVCVCVCERRTDRWTWLCVCGAGSRVDPPRVASGAPPAGGQGVCLALGGMVRVFREAGPGRGN